MKTIKELKAEIGPVYNAERRILKDVLKLIDENKSKITSYLFNLFKEWEVDEDVQVDVTAEINRISEELKSRINGK